MRHLKSYLCWLPLPSESLGLYSLIGLQPKSQAMHKCGCHPLMPIFISSTCGITGLHYTYCCLVSSAAYHFKVYLQNHWIKLDLWLPHLQYILWWLAYTKHLGFQPEGHPMLVTCTFRITGFDFTYGRPTFSPAPPTVQLMVVSSTYRITGCTLDL